MFIPDNSKHDFSDRIGTRLENNFIEKTIEGCKLKDLTK